MSPCVASMFKKIIIINSQHFILWAFCAVTWVLIDVFCALSSRKTDSVHHPDWAVPALPLLLRRENPDAQTLSPSSPPPSPLFPFLSSLSLYHHTDGIRRWGLASKESGCVAGETFHATRVQILKHLLFTNSFKCSNKKYIYSVFLNYDSSVKAITFVDNHLILVLSSCFFLFLFLLLTFW